MPAAPHWHAVCKPTRVKLRTYLGWLVAGAILPVAVFGVIVGSFILEHDRATFQRAAQERALAITTAVDAEIGGSIATAQALGASLDIQRSDFGAFREVAERILRTQPNWSNINLALPSGQQVVNLQRPPGAPLHSIAGVDGSLERILRDRRPVVNDIAFGTITQKWDIAVRVPVIRDGAIQYILSVIVRPESINEILLAQRLPADWVAAVIDRQGRIIARTLRGDELVGQPASASLRERMAKSASGWDEGVTLEGEPVRTAHHRSDLTGWTVAMAIPATAVGAAASRAAWLLALGLLSAVAIAIILTNVVGRRILRPINRLAEAAAGFARGEPAQIPAEAGVREIESLASAMRTAAVATRERQELIEREKAALQEADRAKDEFIAMLSHELRNPLAALTTAAHLLKVGGSDRETAGQVHGVIERQTRQMTRLVEDLLDVSRVTMGKASLERESFDLARTAEGVLATWRTSGRLERHSVSIDTSPAWVNADRARVEQILSNLLDNALKFTPPGNAVRVSVHQEGSEAVLEVADNGEGMAPELAERVFGLFVQGQRNLDRSRGGMGIGLALVQRLAQMHGGSATARSEGPGGGSVFTVRLPATTPAANPAARRPWSRPSRALRLLVVEDNEDARRTLARVLALEGHQVREAVDAESALALVAQFKPHAALIDIGLPDLDGYQLAHRLRAMEQEPMALVAVTGYGQADDRRRALEAGFDTHLTKPVSPEAVLRAVGTLTA